MSDDADFALTLAAVLVLCLLHRWASAAREEVRDAMDSGVHPR
jgi:hypothetical protein